MLLLLLLLGKAVTAVVAAVVHGGHRTHVCAVVVHVRTEQAEMERYLNFNNKNSQSYFFLYFQPTTSKTCLFYSRLVLWRSVCT